MKNDKSFTYEERDGKTILKVEEVIEIDNYNLLQRVEVIADIRGISMIEVGRKFGIDQLGNFKTKLSNAKLTYEEYLKLADILNVTFVNQMIKGSYKIDGSNSRLIKEACDIGDKTQMDVAKYLGITRQAINNRLITDKFTHEEMDSIIIYLGGKYETYFDLDGAKI